MIEFFLNTKMILMVHQTVNTKFFLFLYCTLYNGFTPKDQKYVAKYTRSTSDQRPHIHGVIIWRSFSSLLYLV